MKFGPEPVRCAAGSILAHSVRLPDGVIRKGTRLTDGHTAALQAAGIAKVVVARLGPEDVHEDEAAEAIASAIAGEGTRVEPPFTGRANIFARIAGLAVIDRAAIDGLNKLDPAITVATLPAFAPVAAGQMIATVKIIPFAVSRASLALAQESAPALRVAAFRPLRVGLVATMLPSLKTSVMDKTRRLLDVRLRPAGARVLREERVPHETAAVARALQALRSEGADLLIVFGASAVVDGDDVVPAAIRAAGGAIQRIGMPVDPGNLLVLGSLDGVIAIGAPGCARSPRENGFDWILQRVLAGVAVTSDDIAGLGVGGLLTEIASRPQPRANVPAKVAALLLAAGASERMGAANKLAATIAGRPLVRIAAEAAAGSRAVSLTVVTGYQPAVAEAALAGLRFTTVHNPDFASGLSTSLRVGLANLPADVDGAVVLLADMPGVTAEIVNRLIDAFPGEGIVVPTVNGRRGNPVIWARSHFPELMAVVGDTGGRRIIDANPDAVTEVEVGPAVAIDVDTPEALAAAGGHLA